MIPQSRPSYLQFHIPLDRRAGWYRAVERALGRVKPQEGHFHITVAFIKDEIDLVGARKVAEILDLLSIIHPGFQLESAITKMIEMGSFLHF